MSELESDKTVTVDVQNVDGPRIMQSDAWLLARISVARAAAFALSSSLVSLGARTRCADFGMRRVRFGCHYHGRPRIRQGTFGMTGYVKAVCAAVGVASLLIVLRDPHKIDWQAAEAIGTIGAAVVALYLGGQSGRDRNSKSQAIGDALRARYAMAMDAGKGMRQSAQALPGTNTRDEAATVDRHLKHALDIVLQAEQDLSTLSSRQIKSLYEIHDVLDEINQEVHGIAFGSFDASIIFQPVLDVFALMGALESKIKKW